MRHLIDTYIEADEPRKISPFDGMSLIDLIVKTGIANALSAQLGGLKGNKDAIAETIENNVRSKIIKEHLNDPTYYVNEAATGRSSGRCRPEGHQECSPERVSPSRSCAHFGSGRHGYQHDSGVCDLEARLGRSRISPLRLQQIIEWE